MEKRLLPAMLTTSLVAGIIDIILAFISAHLKSGVKPDGVLKFIASGILGKSAFRGGSGVMLTGLGLHFVIAFLFTAILFFIYPRVNWMKQNKVAAGIVYGICAWLVMNLVVLPLSKVPKIPFTVSEMLIGMSILIIAIGLPIIFFANKYYSNQKYSAYAK